VNGAGGTSSKRFDPTEEEVPACGECGAAMGFVAQLHSDTGMNFGDMGDVFVCSDEHTAAFLSQSS